MGEPRDPGAETPQPQDPYPRPVPERPPSGGAPEPDETTVTGPEAGVIPSDSPGG